MYDILNKVRSDYNPEKMRHYLCGVLDDVTECLRHNDTTSTSAESCERIWFASSCWPPTPINQTAWNSCSPSSDKNSTNESRVGKLALHCNSTLLDWNQRLLTHSCFGNSFESEFDDDSTNSSMYEYGTQQTSGSTYSVAEVLGFLERNDNFDIDLELTDAKYSAFMKGITAVHAISMISLLMALVLLSLLRRLHCTRIYVHMNLMTSFMLRGLIWIIHHFAFRQNDAAHEEAEAATVQMVTLIMAKHYREDVGSLGSMKDQFCSDIGTEQSFVWCRVYYVALNYLVTANYFWLLVEGLYLRLLLSAVMFSHKKYMKAFLLLGWCFPWITVLSSVILKRMNPEEKCWFDFSKGAHWWIINTPIQISLMINFVIFIMVVREVVSKLEDNQRHQVMERNDDYRLRLTKSTLALVPLLGVQYVISAILELANIRNPKVWFALKAYDLGFTAAQGILIAFLYCFCTKEVKEECGKMRRRLMIRWELSRLEQNHLKSQRRSFLHSKRKSFSHSNNSTAVTTSFFMTSRKASDTNASRYVTTQLRHQSSGSVQNNARRSLSDLEKNPTPWHRNQFEMTSLQTTRNNGDISKHDVTMKRFSSPALTREVEPTFASHPKFASCRDLLLESPREVKEDPDVESPHIARSGTTALEKFASLDSVQI